MRSETQARTAGSSLAAIGSAVIVTKGSVGLRLGAKRELRVRLSREPRARMKREAGDALHVVDPAHDSERTQSRP